MSVAREFGHDDYEHCNLCGVRISSLVTRNLGNSFFCANCYDTLVYPLMDILASSIVRLWGGDANNNARREIIRALQPGSGEQVSLGFLRTSEAEGGTAGEERIVIHHPAGIQVEPDNDPKP